MFESFLARRYLLSKRRGALVTLIMFVSVVGVAAGVCALIVASAVSNGLNKQLFRRMLDLQGHIQLSSWQKDAGGNGLGFTNYREVARSIEQIPGVNATSPVIHGPMLLVFYSHGMVRHVSVSVLGIDWEKEKKVTGMNRNIIPAGISPPGDGEVLFGKGFEKSPKFQPGSKMRAMTRFSMAAGSYRPKQTDVRIKGYFEIGTSYFDREFALVSLAQAQKMFFYDLPVQDAVTGLNMNLEDPFEAPQVKQQIEERMKREFPDQEFEIYTWQEGSEELSGALLKMNFGLSVIFVLIIVIAACNIVGTQALVVSRKTREIGILVSMGATRRSIRRVFWNFGMIIGIIGVALGVVGGLIACAILTRYDIVQVRIGLNDAGLPLQVQPLRVLAVALFSIMVCMAASVLPAWTASRINPIEALHGE